MRSGLSSTGRTSRTKADRRRSATPRRIEAATRSLPLVDGTQQSEASVYQTTFNEFLPPSLDAEQLSGVQALPCVPSKQDIPTPISHFP